MLEIINSKLIKHLENGTYTAEYLTHKKKVPMTQDKINKLTTPKKNCLASAYQQALETYNSSKST